MNQLAYNNSYEKYFNKVEIGQRAKERINNLIEKRAVTKQDTSKVKTAKKIGSKILRSGIISWILLLVVWWIASLFNKPDFLPSPAATFDGLIEIISKGILWTDIKVSLFRVLIGWGRAVLLAVPIGLLIGRFKTVRAILEPLIQFFRFVPAIGFLTLFLMWFGIGEESKRVLITYAAMFPIIINTLQAVYSIDPVKYQAAESLGAGRFHTFFTVTIPSAVPGILTGVRLGLSSAIISIVAAEMLAANEGLGYRIYTSRMYYRTDWIFVGIVILGILGFVADKLIRFIARKYFRYYGVTK